MRKRDKSMAERLSAAVEGKFVPSVWWGRGIVILYWLKRRPVAMRTAPPPTGRWQPPKIRRQTERRPADTRRMERLGLQARRVQDEGR
jgi:hypothetical protein